LGSINKFFKTVNKSEIWLNSENCEENLICTSCKNLIKVFMSMSSLGLSSIWAFNEEKRSSSFEFRSFSNCNFRWNVVIISHVSQKTLFLLCKSLFNSLKWENISPKKILPMSNFVNVHYSLLKNGNIH